MDYKKTNAPTNTVTRDIIAIRETFMKRYALSANAPTR